MQTRIKVIKLPLALHKNCISQCNSLPLARTLYISISIPLSGSLRPLMPIYEAGRLTPQAAVSRPHLVARSPAQRDSVHTWDKCVDTAEGGGRQGHLPPLQPSKKPMHNLTFGHCVSDRCRRRRRVGADAAGGISNYV